MVFSDSTLQSKLETFYFSEYLSILENRKVRKNLAHETFMNGDELPDKPFERTIRNFLNSLNKPLDEKALSLINEKLQPNNCIPIGDPKEQDYLNALEKSKQFVWPDANELVIRENEKNQLVSYMDANPTTVKFDVSASDFIRSLYLAKNT